MNIEQEFRTQTGNETSKVKFDRDATYLTCDGKLYSYTVYTSYVKFADVDERGAMALKVFTALVDAGLGNAHELDIDENTVSAPAYDSDDTSYTFFVNSDLTITEKSVSETSTDRTTYESFEEFMGDL